MIIRNVKFYSEHKVEIWEKVKLKLKYNKWYEKNNVTFY